jgi:hypothetical protein
MHANDQEDLSNVERRLAGWNPSVDGLDADAMLFAAGLAAARMGRGKLVAPIMCMFLAAVAAAFCFWALTERSERLDLASRLRARDRVADASQPPPTVARSETLPKLSPFAYYNMRRRIEQEAERSRIAVPPESPQTVPPPAAESAVFKVRQSSRLLDQ